MASMPDIEALNLALRSADWPLAERLLRQLLALRPRDPGTHYNLGLVLWRRGDLKGAEAMLRATIGLSSGHQNARFELASLLLERGTLVEATRLLEDYVAAVPHDGDGWINLARARLKSGDADGAIRALQQAETCGGHDPLTWAEAERDLGDVDAARRRLGQMVARDPASAPAALKVATQGARGRLSLDAARLYSPR